MTPDNRNVDRRVSPSSSSAAVAVGLHPKNFCGECRDNDNRFAPDQLDAKYGADGWEEIPLDDEE
jgi:hypothetical protein